MNWKIQTIENALREIHPDFKKALIDGGEIEVWFNGVSHASGARSFIPGSATRNLLDELEELLLDEEGDADEW